MDELRQRQLRHLAADVVEGRDHDGLRRVVDDDVHAGRVLERADVPALAADDPPLHVVGGKLDERDGGLRGMARRNALEGVGDEVAGAALGVGAGFFLHLPHHAPEIVADELLRALEHVALRLFDREAGDALELPQLFVLRRLGLLLELLQVRLAVEEALLAAFEVGEPLVDPPLLRGDAFLDLDDLRTPVFELLLEFGAQLERVLARLHLSLTADGRGGPLGVGVEALALLFRVRCAPRDEEPGAHEGAREHAEGDPDDQEADGSSHCSLLRDRARRNGGFGESAARRRASSAD